MSLARLRIVNKTGDGVMTRVWLDNVEIGASIDRLVIDVDDVVTVTLRLPAAAVEYDGMAEVVVAPTYPIALGCDGTKGTEETPE